ncbi:DUF3144 domain-containing protein [Phyllobacterium sp. 22552]|uniref:DUF3144 domain-containing protein n=1 Tax=Phyllobacterium sp. 22552 TaxID=3453941 RepID=UPI003F862A71
MTSEPNEEFFLRADAVIGLANSQMKDATPGEVSSSCMYATARFNAFVSAMGHSSSAELKAVKAETIDYFVKQYRAMLDENIEDHIERFEELTNRPT